MDRLDHATENLFLTHAATGYDVTLRSEADKALVARWCSLAAALLDHTQASPVIGAATHEAIYRGDVPEGVRIWLFQTKPPPSQLSVIAESRTWNMKLSSRPGDDRDAYFTTFGINHFVAQVFVPTDRTLPGISFDRKDTQMFRVLWPSTLMPLTYPPPASIASGDLPRWADVFQGPTK